MSLSSKSAEIHRLLEAFEVEASKFHDLRLSTLFVTQTGASFDRKFVSPHHEIIAAAREAAGPRASFRYRGDREERANR